MYRIIEVFFRISERIETAHKEEISRPTSPWSTNSLHFLDRIHDKQPFSLYLQLPTLLHLTGKRTDHFRSLLVTSWLRRRELELISGLCQRVPYRAYRQLNRVASPEIDPSKAPRLDPLNTPNDAIHLIDKENIDGKGHPDHMDRLTGRDNECLARLDPLPVQEASSALLQRQSPMNLSSYQRVSSRITNQGR